MGIEHATCTPDNAYPFAPPTARDLIHVQRVLDMTSALEEMFGAAALSIASNQPDASDVGGDSGVCWQDLVDALRKT